jgi:hypothetical protein
LNEILQPEQIILSIAQLIHNIVIIFCVLYQRNQIWNNFGIARGGNEFVLAKDDVLEVGGSIVAQQKVLKSNEAKEWE